MFGSFEKSDTPKRADTPKMPDTPKKADALEKADTLENADALKMADSPKKITKPEPRAAGAATTREDVFNILPDYPDDEPGDGNDPSEEKITFKEALRDKFGKARRLSMDILGLMKNDGKNDDSKKDDGKRDDGKKDDRMDGASKKA